MSGSSGSLPLTDSEPASRGFFQRFGVLKDGARELWLVFAIKFIAVAAYALTNSTIKLWLSSDLGYSDKQALGLVAAWSLMMTVFTLLVGSLTDAIGLRKTFFLGIGVCAVARAVMVLANTRILALAGGLLPLALGEALSTPVLVAAVRRYSNTRQRSISFSLFYAMMNVGFLIAGFLFDFMREHFKEHGQVNLVVLQISTYRSLFLLSLLLELALLPIVYA